MRHARRRAHRGHPLRPGRAPQPPRRLPAARAVRPCPTLLQIHGGGWTIGQKDQQALPLMYHLAARGWVCVAANYRLRPRATFPDHLIDVKRALAWIRTDGARVRRRSATSSSSPAAPRAGTSRRWSPSPPTIPRSSPASRTSTPRSPPASRSTACTISSTATASRGKRSMAPFLERVVMKCSPQSARALGQARRRSRGSTPTRRRSSSSTARTTRSPTSRRRGTSSSALRSVSRNPVVYAELPGAQHAFDIFHSRRSAHAVDAVACFLEYLRALYAPPPAASERDCRRGTARVTGKTSRVSLLHRRRTACGEIGGDARLLRPALDRRLGAPDDGLAAPGVVRHPAPAEGRRRRVVLRLGAASWA